MKFMKLPEFIRSESKTLRKIRIYVSTILCNYKNFLIPPIIKDEIIFLFSYIVCGYKSHQFQCELLQRGNVKKVIEYRISKKPGMPITK